MSNPCNDQFSLSIKPQLLSWLQKAKRASKGRFVVYSAVFGVLEAIREHGWPIARSYYVSKGNQIRMNKHKFEKVLTRALGPKRTALLKVPREGGRTTRSTPAVADKFVDWLKSVFPPELDSETAKDYADCLELFASEDFEQFMLSQAGISVPKPSPQFPLSEFVQKIIEKAGNKRGAVIHHLVGAKLAIRLGQSDELEPRPYTAADKQIDVPGDYWYRNTAFHVTAAPSGELLKKCQDNLAKGWRVWIITLREGVETARILAKDLDAKLAKNIQVVSVPEFVGQNLEEIGAFASDNIAQQAERLLQEYNDRIDKAEDGDPTLKIIFGS
ncbi:MAG TPA: DUF4928 domain-containing protein [Chloroflexi bacterium]|nr:DUF4928 domain-containing protein [Chloroflexota bacterium]